jgi:hypothetical protein
MRSNVWCTAIFMKLCSNFRNFGCLTTCNTQRPRGGNRNAMHATRQMEEAKCHPIDMGHESFKARSYVLIPRPFRRELLSLEAMLLQQSPARRWMQRGADVQCRVTHQSQGREMESSPGARPNWWFDHVAGLKKIGGNGSEPRKAATWFFFRFNECASTVLPRWARQHATASRVRLSFYLCFPLLATPPIIGYSRQGLNQLHTRHNYLKSCINLALWSKGYVAG